MTVCAALDAIDVSLRAAVAERNRCLRAWIRSPNTDRRTDLDQAVAELDAKLEQRYAAQ